MRFLAEKTDGGERKGRISLYCRVLKISRQGFYRYLARQGRPWKYQGLVEAMRAIHNEDLCNDTYGRRRMRQALLLAQPEGVRIPGGRSLRWGYGLILTKSVFRMKREILVNTHG